jgi:ribosomal protein S27E
MRNERNDRNPLLTFCPWKIAFFRNPLHHPNKQPNGDWIQARYNSVQQLLQRSVTTERTESEIPNLNREKAYLLVRCQNCGFFSIARTNQKTRLCARCGKTIMIDRFQSRKVDDFEEARKLLGELNSKLRTEALAERENTQIISNSQALPKDHTRESSKGLLRTFREDILPKFMNKEVEVSQLVAECIRFGLTREYTQKLLKELLDSGQAYQSKKDWIKLL